jgi:hypothetical protein
MRNARHNLTINHVKEELAKIIDNLEESAQEETSYEFRSVYTSLAEELNNLYIYIKNSERSV